MTYVTGKKDGSGVQPPAALADLLQRPLVGFLATKRPDGGVQCNPMWYEYDGTNIRLSHTDDRQKWRNVSRHPEVSLAIADPDNEFRYVEIRGVVSASEPDTGARFHRALRERYSMNPEPVPDEDRRIVVTITPTFIGGRDLEDQRR